MTVAGGDGVRIAGPRTVIRRKARASRGVLLACWLATACLGTEAVFAQNAQNKDDCFFLCAPALKFEPTWTIENLLRSPKVARLEAGEPIEVTEEGQHVVFETVLSVDIPTEVPRLGFVFEAIWAPFENTDRNVFTGNTASELSVKNIRHNPVELEFEADFDVITEEQTRGWLGSHFDIVDQYSPAKRPKDRGLYTHKLNLEFDTAISIFHFLPDRNWLRNLELEFSLDYLPGVPKAGDRFGDELFITGASPWSLSIVFSIPIAPLRP